MVLSADVETSGHQNVTVAIGRAHTFVPRDDSFLGSPVAFLQIFRAIAALGRHLAIVLVTASATGAVGPRSSRSTRHRRTWTW